MNQIELQQVTAAQALVKALNERYCGSGPKYPDSLRNRLDDELLSAYAEDGTDRKRVSINGESTATYSVVAGRPQEVRQLVVDDEAAFLDWLQTCNEGRDVLQILLCGKGHAALMAAAWAELEGVGVVPDGCRVDIHTEPGRPPHTMLKVDNEAFARAIDGSLTSAVALLGEGEG